LERLSVSANYETENFKAYFHDDSVAFASKESGGVIYTLDADEYREIREVMAAWSKGRALAKRLANPQPWKCDECGHRKANHAPGLVRCYARGGCDCGEWRCS
jgi:hypothetical protein